MAYNQTIWTAGQTLEADLLNNSTTNMIVEYTLKEEVVIPYTQTQQAQWNAIKALNTYKNITNINATSNVDPGLKIVYYKDLETIIENIESRL